MSSSAPKFASFRPKPKPAEHLPSEESRREEKDHRKHLPPGGTRREERRTSPSRQKRSHERSEPSRAAFFSDRRGDLDIVKYGTPNCFDVPVYRRSGYGNILGLPGQKIDRESSTDKRIYMIPLVRPRQKRMLTDKHAARESVRALRFVKVAKGHQTDTTCDFIALSDTKKRKRGSGSGTDSEEHDDDPLAVRYRGITGREPDPDRNDDPDAFYESGTEAAIVSSRVAQKNSRLIRETHNDPGNLQAWLDLIEHQESMMKLDRAISELSAADRQNLADVRISTYEEALRKIGHDERSQIELHHGLLREAQIPWDKARVATKWQAVLKKHPHSVKLWFGYLDFVQSTFSSFRYEHCRAVFFEALEALRLTEPGHKTTTSEARLHIFVRLTTLIRQAGYQELALAIWQAVLEFHLLVPHSLDADKLQQFEEFWESEAPRIGEPDCKGWRHTLIDDVVPPACSIALETSDFSTSSIADFRRRELDCVDKLCYPGRSTDDVGEDDPFHTIFFSDLKGYVTSFPEVSANMQIDAFLCFCGLPALIKQSQVSPWRNDAYLQGASFFETTMEKMTGSLQYQEALSRYSRTPLAKFQMVRDLLVQQTFSLHNTKLSPEFVRNTLKLLATHISDSEFVGEYLLAFESRHFPWDVTKTAKRLLKDNPSSVRLYTVYGLTEDDRGNSAKANQIFAAAINIKSASVDRLELLVSYIWQALHEDDKAEALRRLVQYQDRLSSKQPSKPDPDSIDKTRAVFQTSLENALLSRDYASAILNATLLALLAYLSSDCNIYAALEVYTNLTLWFASHKLSSSTCAEIQSQAVARLLAYHVTHTPVVKPALLRTTLEPLIAAFRDNTILLSTYAANEARFSVDDRVRGNMHRILDTSPESSATTWAFAIHHETLKGEIAGSTSHSVRSLYKHATAFDASGAHCSVLWQMYLQFEIIQWHREEKLRPNKRPRRDGRKSKWENMVAEARDRVKDTFYQGLKMLPWCKDFAMLAFTDAKDVFSDEELWGLYRVMVEKELRVYTEMKEPGL